VISFTSANDELRREFARRDQQSGSRRVGTLSISLGGADEKIRLNDLLQTCVQLFGTEKTGTDSVNRARAGDVNAIR